MRLSRTLAVTAILAAVLLPPPAVAGLALTTPVDWQVVQRHQPDKAQVQLRAAVTDAPVPGTVSVRLGSAAWQEVPATAIPGGFSATMDLPVGGWHRLDVRCAAGDASVAHVGAGEVFIVAGQSNSANHGEERQRPRSGLVVSRDGMAWRPADDPQPGASGSGGSFIPPLGDALAERFGVPIGFICCGIGATSVREWLPEGATFPAPPTIESRVRRRPDGAWESNGAAWQTLAGHLTSLGPHGCRAVLWHQGESDANQADASRTLPGALYRRCMEDLIRSTRRAAAWDVPWFVARVSYHVPGDEGSPDIREAQASLARDGIALPGPDSDALNGALRENNGRGVHFSGPGLREHGARWAAVLTPWLERRLEPSKPAPPERK